MAMAVAGAAWVVFLILGLLVYRAVAGSTAAQFDEMLQQQAVHSESGGTLSWILSALSISAKIIAARVRCARLEDVLGQVGHQNIQGEQQQKLDVIANEVLLRTLGGREGVAIIASEENEEPVILRTARDGEHKYCVLFDPLDGSSNLDICGSVGTIFSILAHESRSLKPEDSLRWPCRIRSMGRSFHLISDAQSRLTSWRVLFWILCREG